MTVSTAVSVRSAGSCKRTSSMFGFLSAACLYSSRSWGIGVVTAVRTGGGSAGALLLEEAPGVGSADACRHSRGTSVCSVPGGASLPRAHF